jgi:hypothetical protein
MLLSSIRDHFLGLAQRPFGTLACMYACMYTRRLNANLLSGILDHFLGLAQRPFGQQWWERCCVSLRSELRFWRHVWPLFLPLEQPDSFLV